jgi:hypothetical protein
VFLGELAAERPYGFGLTVLYSSGAEIVSVFLMFGARGDLGSWGGVRQVFGAGVMGRGVLAERSLGVQLGRRFAGPAPRW